MRVVAFADNEKVGYRRRCFTSLVVLNIAADASTALYLLNYDA